MKATYRLGPKRVTSYVTHDGFLGLNEHRHETIHQDTIKTIPWLPFKTLRMGPYDDQIMPALMLFEDTETPGTCSNIASRHLYDPREKYPGEF